MENLKSQFIQIIQDQIGDDLFCYIINSSNFKDKEIDFKFEKLLEEKDPFFKEKSIIYMEAYFLNTQTSNEIQNNRKLKI